MSDDKIVRALGNHDATRLIRFKEGTRIAGRKPGIVYEVDADLAAHYCERLEVADYVDKGKGRRKPAQVEDRAMAAPPRGRGKKVEQ